MHRKFIALVLSAALAITGMSVAPARADDTDKWIAGAAALAIIGLAIHEEKKKKRKRKAQHYYNQQTHQHHGYSHSHNHGYQDHSHSTTHGHAGPLIVTPNAHGGHNRHKWLPASCRVTKKFHGRDIRGFARGCLKRNNVDVRALPKDCKYRIVNHNTGNKRVIFGSRCLRDRGYRVAKGY